MGIKQASLQVALDILVEEESWFANMICYTSNDLKKAREEAY